MPSDPSVKIYYIYLCGILTYYSCLAKSIQTLCTIAHLWTITVIYIGIGTNIFFFVLVEFKTLSCDSVSLTIVRGNE